MIADFKCKDIYRFYKDKYGDKAKDFSTFCRVWIGSLRSECKWLSLITLNYTCPTDLVP